MNSTLITIIEGVGLVLTVTTIAAGIYAMFRSKLASNTIGLYKDNNTALEDRVKLLEASDIAKTKQIFDLQAEIKTLKTLPLEQLATSYDLLVKNMTDIAATQTKILEAIVTKPVVVTGKVAL